MERDADEGKGGVGDVEDVFVEIVGHRAVCDEEVKDVVGVVD